MSCQKVREHILLMLDRRLTAEEWEVSEAHIRSCRQCDAHLEDARRMRHGLRGLAHPAVPERLSARLRVLASHEHARRVARLDFAARLREWKADFHLFVDNLMRPFAVPVTGGLFTAMISFSLLVPTLNPFQHSTAYEPPLAVVTGPEGQLVGGSFYGPRLEPGDATINGNEVSLVLLIDERGHVQDFYLSGGELTNDMINLILLSRFTPATIDGQPTWGLKQVVFRPNGPGQRRMRS
jgi:hypothetical protein